MVKLGKSWATWNKLVTLQIISQVEVALYVGKAEPWVISYIKI